MLTRLRELALPLAEVEASFWPIAEVYGRVSGQTKLQQFESTD